ncbi:MAG: hypothetical protein SAK29_42755 [Scytonema sp. PMC 1069.18]|nr:hypothetical protein [Scytonema sp. PMC 1069.18]MEC4881105.1 hypothetical protein [Scytonema sp. PMC 1070.18]
MIDQTLNITGLTLEQIEQIKAIIEAFKAKNQLEQNQIVTEEKLSISNNNDDINMDDLFFASEILIPFNRSILYGQRN